MKKQFLSIFPFFEFCNILECLKIIMYYLSLLSAFFRPTNDCISVEFDLDENDAIGR